MLENQKLMIMFSVSVPQVVSHLLWPSQMDHNSPKSSYHIAAQTSPYSPRCPSRYVLLYNNRLAKFPAGETRVLDKIGGLNRDMLRI